MARASDVAYETLRGDILQLVLEPGATLEAAQLRKIQLLLDRLDLKPGQRLLEIGCGWGTLAIEAA